MPKTSSRTYKGSQNETYKNILDAATRLFAEHGYDRVGMRDVCDLVGVSLPSVYHYFKDKQNLYRAVELANFGRVEARLIKAMNKAGSPILRLKAFMTELYNLLNSDASFRNLAIRNMLDPDVSHHKFLVSHTLQELFDRLVTLLREYRKDVDAEVLAYAMISGIFGFVVLSPSKPHIQGYPKARSKAKERDSYIEHLLQSVNAF